MKDILEAQAIARANELMLLLAHAVDGRPMGDIAGALATLLTGISTHLISTASRSVLVNNDEQELRRFVRATGEQLIRISESYDPQMHPKLRTAVDIIKGGQWTVTPWPR